MIENRASSGKFFRMLCELLPDTNKSGDDQLSAAGYFQTDPPHTLAASD